MLFLLKSLVYPMVFANLEESVNKECALATFCAHLKNGKKKYIAEGYILYAIQFERTPMLDIALKFVPGPYKLTMIFLCYLMSSVTQLDADIVAEA